MDPNEMIQEQPQGQEQPAALGDQSGAQEGQESSSAGVQGAEGGAPAAEAPKPVERPKHWQNKPEAIPYDRFQEVNNRRDQAERERDTLRARLEELERTRTPQADPDDLDAIDAAKFTDAAGNFDGAAYMRERDRRVTARAEKRALEVVERTLTQRDTQQQTQAVVAKAETEFRGQVAEASKANPQVAEAVEYLDSIAKHIPFSVQMAILRSAPEVAHAIALDPSLVAQITQGNPADSIMVIGEINGRIKASRPAAQVPATGGIPAFQPSSAPAQAPKGAPVPRTLSGGGGGGANPSQASLNEYFRKREAGEW